MNDALIVTAMVLAGVALDVTIYALITRRWRRWEEHGRRWPVRSDD
jgi:hypothetical protein